MTKLKKFFELDRKYKFDPTDLTAVIFTIAAIMGMSGLNPHNPILHWLGYWHCFLLAGS